METIDMLVNVVLVIIGVLMGVSLLLIIPAKGKLNLLGYISIIAGIYLSINGEYLVWHSAIVGASVFIVSVLALAVKNA